MICCCRRSSGIHNLPRSSQGHKPFGARDSRLEVVPDGRVAEAVRALERQCEIHRGLVLQTSQGRRKVLATTNSEFSRQGLRAAERAASPVIQFRPIGPFRLIFAASPLHVEISTVARRQRHIYKSWHSGSWIKLCATGGALEARFGRGAAKRRQVTGPGSRLCATGSANTRKSVIGHNHVLSYGKSFVWMQWRPTSEAKSPNVSNRTCPMRAHAWMRPRALSQVPPAAAGVPRTSSVLLPSASLKLSQYLLLKEKNPVARARQHIGPKRDPLPRHESKSTKLRRCLRYQRAADG